MQTNISLKAIRLLNQKLEIYIRIQQREEEVKRVNCTNLPSLVRKEKIQSTYSCIWRRSILGYPTSTTSPRSSTASSTSSSTSTPSSSVLNSVKLDSFVQRHIYFILCGHFASSKDGNCLVLKVTR